MNFLPIPGYEGLYEASDTGLIRSVDRNIMGVDNVIYPKKGKLLTLTPHKDLMYLIVSLWKDNKGSTFYVHRLVAQAHIPNPLNLPEVNHKNGVKLYNYVDNLEWVTRKDNILHAINTGLKVCTNRLTKEEFVECLLSVIDGESYASVCTRVPYKVPFLSVKLRKIAKELNLEDELNASLMEQRINRARINGAKNYHTN